MPLLAAEQPQPETPAVSEEDQLKQIKEFIASYNKLTEQCFTHCIHDFTTREVRTKEDTCTMNCLTKFLKGNQRTTQRFHEYQMIAAENAIAAAKKAGQLK